MSVKIRLMRVGKTKQPTYRVVVADSRSPRDGRIIETIGHYGPRQDPSQLDLDSEKALDWLRKGAQPSEQVQKLLTIAGVWATFEAEKGGKKIVTKLNRRGYRTGKDVTPKKSKKAAAEEPAAEAPAAKADADAPAEDSAPVAEAEAEAPAAEEAAPAEDAPAEEPAAEEPAAEEASE